MQTRIDLTASFVKGMDFDAFREDIKTVAAVRAKMRKDCIPDQPWRNIRGLGNWLRHQYDSVGREIIWNTIHEDSPKLKNAVFQAIDNRRPKMHPEAAAPE